MQCTEKGNENASINLKIYIFMFIPVSYTHLDVYKRQELR